MYLIKKFLSANKFATSEPAYFGFILSFFRYHVHPTGSHNPNDHAWNPHQQTLFKAWRQVRKVRVDCACVLVVVVVVVV
jgi:hypothetical protein